MKTILRTSAVALVTLLSTTVSANTGNGNGTNGTGNGSGNTNLTVNVAELYSIIVDENATINLSTQEDFTKGTKSNMTSMTVFASKGYKITATASGEKFSSNKQGAGELPAVNNIDIIVSKKSAASAERTTTLTSNGDVVFNSPSGEKNTEFNVQYHIPAEKTGAFLTTGGQTLQTVITYTITGN